MERRLILLDSFLDLENSLLGSFHCFKLYRSFLLFPIILRNHDSSHNSHVQISICNFFNSFSLLSPVFPRFPRSRDYDHCYINNRFSRRSNGAITCFLSSLVSRVHGPFLGGTAKFAIEAKLPHYR